MLIANQIRKRVEVVTMSNQYKKRPRPITESDRQRLEDSVPGPVTVKRKTRNSKRLRDLAKRKACPVIVDSIMLNLQVHIEKILIQMTDSVYVKLKNITENAQLVSKDVQEMNNADAKEIGQTHVSNIKPGLKQSHIDAVMDMYRLRFKNSISGFRSRRIVFLDTVFQKLWRERYHEFVKDRSCFPGGAGEYYRGDYPSYAATKLNWGVHVDNLYSVVRVKGRHWVAMDVSFLKREITIYDSALNLHDDKVVQHAIRPFAEMIPCLFKLMSHSDDQHSFRTDPFKILRRKEKVPQIRYPYGDCAFYALKFVECLAMDVKFSEDHLRDKMTSLRLKLAAEMYEETTKYGHDMCKDRVLRVCSKASAGQAASENDFWKLFEELSAQHHGLAKPTRKTFMPTPAPAAAGDVLVAAKHIMHISSETYLA